jgi:hypothetical protein
MKKYRIVKVTHDKLDKEFYEHVIKASKKWNDIKTEFNILSEEKFGFAYYTPNLDVLYDLIEFGEGNMSYEKFCKIMISHTPSNLP